jgi:hypothetical protein
MVRVTQPHSRAFMFGTALPNDRSDFLLDKEDADSIAGRGGKRKKNKVQIFDAERSAKEGETHTHTHTHNSSRPPHHVNYRSSPEPLAETSKHTQA